MRRKSDASWNFCSTSKLAVAELKRGQVQHTHSLFLTSNAVRNTFRWTVFVVREGLRRAGCCCSDASTGLKLKRCDSRVTCPPSDRCSDKARFYARKKRPRRNHYTHGDIDKWWGKSLYFKHLTLLFSFSPPIKSFSSVYFEGWHEKQFLGYGYSGAINDEYPNTNICPTGWRSNIQISKYPDTTVETEYSDIRVQPWYTFL